MPSQVPPVAAAVAVPLARVVGSLYILVDGARIVGDTLDIEDSLWQMLYWSGFKIANQLDL